ncbi:hypothetical protein D791_01145 [Nitrincola nitratireducens]|uniref:Uncharacterized protein n=1 Tax=Nitrincola nitratireducens TaxID=1229521 RepID=W9V5Q1_9GAMM|nr:hypothetical protein D791_01145 [Nitrincola nitratireducens]
MINILSNIPVSYLLYALGCEKGVKNLQFEAMYFRF